MKKYIVGAVLTVGFFVSPLVTQAASLTSVQVQAILGLLQSFGADAATIANVTASLNGTASTGTTAVPAPAPGPGICHSFRTDLKLGNEDSGKDGSGDVGPLQRVLANAGFTAGMQENLAHAPTGGMQVSTYFGTATQSAVKQFQAKYGIAQTGYVGPATRAKLNALYACPGK